MTLKVPSRPWRIAVLAIAGMLLGMILVYVIGEQSIRADARERERKLPGDELIANPIGSVTHAITIRSPPQDVWPWLVQMGAGRAGWYSYDFVDNGGHRSTDRILPQFQTIDVGTVFPALPGATDAFVVLQYEPERWLVLGWVLPAERVPVTTWALVLEELGSGRTRLIERGRVRSPYRPYGLPEWLTKRLAPVAHGVMVRRHMLGIARRAEARTSSPPNPALEPTARK